MHKKAALLIFSSVCLLHQCTILHNVAFFYPPKKAKNSRESVFLSPIALSRIAIEKRHTNAFSLNRRMFAQEHEQKEQENHIRPKRTMRAKSEEKKVQAGLATEKGCRNCKDHEREKKVAKRNRNFSPIVAKKSADKCMTNNHITATLCKEKGFYYREQDT